MFQFIGMKDAMNEDTFMAGIMCATLTKQHIQEEMLGIIFQTQANPAKENAYGTANLIINKDSGSQGYKPFQQKSNGDYITFKRTEFSPTPYNSNNQELTTDIKEYTRKIRLAEYFYSVDTEEKKSLLRNLIL